MTDDEFELLVENVVLVLGDRLPDHLVTDYKIHLSDDSVLVFSNFDDLVDTVELLRFDVRVDPVVEIECCADLDLMKIVVERDTARLLSDLGFKDEQ